MSIAQVILATFVVVLGAGGTYLLLPHAHGSTQPSKAHAAGAILAGLALLGFIMFLTPPGPFLSGLFFYIFSIASLVGALLTVTSRNPIHSALWFASVVVSTAGLFLLAGAQFLAAGTIIVYAGAIIVTFLFVIMLAQMEGKAEYDRASRAPGASTLTCFMLLWSLMYALSGVAVERDPQGSYLRDQLTAERGLVRSGTMLGFFKLSDRSGIGAVLKQAIRPTSSLRDSSGADKANVAGLGEALYTDHLVTVELAGGLLFVALIAAVAITNPRRPVRPGDRPPGERAGLAP